MQFRTTLLTSICFAAFILALTPRAGAKKATPSPTGSPTPSASPAASPSTRPIPYHGRISAVDVNAQTFTLAGKSGARVLKITALTKILRNDTAGSISDVQAGAMVRGSYWKRADGSLEAKSVKLGEKLTRAKAHSGLITRPVPTASATP